MKVINTTRRVSGSSLLHEATTAEPLTPFFDVSRLAERRRTESYGHCIPINSSTGTEIPSKACRPIISVMTQVNCVPAPVQQRRLLPKFWSIGAELSPLCGPGSTLQPWNSEPSLRRTMPNFSSGQPMLSSPESAIALFSLASHRPFQRCFLSNKLSILESLTISPNSRIENTQTFHTLHPTSPVAVTSGSFVGDRQNIGKFNTKTTAFLLYLGVDTTEDEHQAWGTLLAFYIHRLC